MDNELKLLSEKVSILIVPGLYGSGSKHWQTIWEHLYGFTRIEQQCWDDPLYSDWNSALQTKLNQTRSCRDTVLIAHSLGCHLVAKSFIHIKNLVKGIMLVAPPDLSTLIRKKDVYSFIRTYCEPLGVQGALVYSENDPYASTEYSSGLAENLGLKPINVGLRGHINRDSNLGDWDEGALILKQLLQERLESYVIKKCA